MVFQGELMSVLEGLKSTADIKKLNIEELKKLAEEIRAEILDVTAKNGGHLASNLGVVEATIALYYVFDLPTDKLVFDVGHQCYAYKILSGRNERFSTIRTDGGLSGFPDREESEFDSFNTGHAGTSIAAGLGFCMARDKKDESYRVISMVGDGAIVNGLNQEALTAFDEKPKNFIVILNDNGMSISKNRNGFYRFLSKQTTTRGYLRGKRALKKIFGTSFITRVLVRVRDFIKRVTNKTGYFENHGFKYVGVVDGNDIKTMISILNRVKEVAKDKAVFLHIKTTKGKGYEKAEERSDKYHGVGTDLRLDSGKFSVVLGNKLNDIIEKDKNVVAITAGMKDGTGLTAVERINPKNFYDVGIAEEFAVTMAAGMASGGLKPVVAIYSTFMQRAYDQILHDVCLQNLPVVFCLDRAGLVGKDGKTHQGTFDLSFLTHMPNMQVFAPTTLSDFEEILEYALSLNSPVAIRYPKNPEKELPVKSIKDGMWSKFGNGTEVSLLAVGPKALKIALEVMDKDDGVSVYAVRQIKPLSTEILDKIIKTHVITIEENVLIGGVGQQVCAYYSMKNKNVKVDCFGVKDQFTAHGSVDNQLEINQISYKKVIEKINERKSEKHE